MASYSFSSILDQQQTVYPEVPLSSYLPTSTPGPTQDLMTDYRTNNSLLFLSDATSLPYCQQISFPSPPAPEVLSSDPCSMSVIPGSTVDVKSDSPGNSLYSDILQMIVSECQQTSLPSSLFQFSSHQQDVTSRELAILTRLRRLEQTTGDKVKDLSTLFRHHSASIEMERVQMLSIDNTQHYKAWLNSHFDQQRHQVMDRVERSLQLLEERAESEKQERDLVAGVRRRSPLTRRSIQLMENWYSSHQEHPYPSATIVEALSRSGNITTDQVKKWFANKRLRNCNTRSLTEIAKKKHQAKFGMKSVHVALQHDLF